jgi:hypothetical protein
MLAGLFAFCRIGNRDWRPWVVSSGEMWPVSRGWLASSQPQQDRNDDAGRNGGGKIGAPARRLVIHSMASQSAKLPNASRISLDWGSTFRFLIQPRMAPALKAVRSIRGSFETIIIATSCGEYPFARPTRCNERRKSVLNAAGLHPIRAIALLTRIP